MLNTKISLISISLLLVAGACSKDPDARATRPEPAAQPEPDSAVAAPAAKVEATLPPGASPSGNPGTFRIDGSRTILYSEVGEGSLRFEFPGSQPLHEHNDCLLTLSKTASGVQVFFQEVDDPSSHNVFGSVTAELLSASGDTIETESASWGAGAKSNPVSAGKLEISYVPKAPRVAPGFEILYRGVAEQQTVVFTFSELFWLENDTGPKKRYTHGDPNVVIKAVSNPQDSSEKFPDSALCK